MAARQAMRLAETGTPAIAAAHFRVESRPFDPVRDPDGYLNLGTAENRLLWDLLEPRLTASRAISADDARYALPYGTPALRAAVANLLRRTHGRIDPDDLIIVAGASAALDIAATALCDPGEGAVIAAPYYSGFDADLTYRSGAAIVRAQGDPDTFAPDPRRLAQAVDDAARTGVTTRALALATPANPVGTVFGRAQLDGLAEFAAAYDLDVIADEIYANCVFGPTRFLPLAAPAADPPIAADRVHTVWGFAKDFGLPGLKVGVLHTTDPTVRAAARELAYFASVSTDTQALLTALLADEAWVDAFLAESRARLLRSYQDVTGLLDGLGIGYAPAQAGFSVWADLSPWLPAPGFAGEAALYADLLDRARLNILPGAVFHTDRPGWFRICHATDPRVVAAAFARLGDLLQATPDRV